MAARSVVVVGAGIVGMAAASFLLRDGNAVTVIDEREPGDGCSYGNAGAISPDMVVPMSTPGMLAKIPGWLMDPLGPLAIRPGYLPTALPWLMRWVAAGRMPRVEASSAALRRLHKPVFDVYRELLGAQFHDHVRTGGQLYVWRSDEVGRNERIADALRAAAGVRAEKVGIDELRQMEPALAPAYRRGLWLPDNGHTANPKRLVAALAELFQRAGGQIQRARVRQIEVVDGKARAVRTAEGMIPADLVVVAAGAWSGRLVRPLGVRVPLEAERGYHVMLPDPGIDIRNKLSNRSSSFSVTVMEGGVRLAGTVEIAGLDAPPMEERALVLLRQAQEMFPGIRTEGYRTWMGFRPGTPDSVPVVGPAPGVRDLYLDFGHGHTGLTGAPMSGRLLADLVAGRTPAIDPSSYSATRFGTSRE
ncbi:MAG: FAD-dependent oxidoreductase [Alphaproteobacteria bacterium]|nr:FAD-dependent oxidoreductase [Alphaproteobacteria bacterium]